MLFLRLSCEIEKQLAELARNTGRSRGSHVRQAILQYLEDLEDARLAEERLKEAGESVPIETLMNEFGMDQEFPK